MNGSKRSSRGVVGQSDTKYSKMDAETKRSAIDVILISAWFGSILTRGILRWTLVLLIVLIVGGDILRIAFEDGGEKEYRFSFGDPQEEGENR